MGRTAGKLFIVILLASICYVEIFSKELYVVIPKTQICKVLDPTIIYNITCISKNLNRTTNIGSKEIFYQPGVSITNLYVNIVLYRKFATIWRQFMVDITVDVCAINAGNESVISKVLNIERRRKYGNLNDPCPISVRRYEYNVTFDYSTLPDIIPAGEYRIDMTSFTIVNGEKKKLILTQSFGEAKTTTAEHWRK